MLKGWQVTQLRWSEQGELVFLQVKVRKAGQGESSVINLLNVISIQVQLLQAWHVNEHATANLLQAILPQVEFFQSLQIVEDAQSQFMHMVVVEKQVFQVIKQIKHSRRELIYCIGA